MGPKRRRTKSPYFDQVDELNQSGGDNSQHVDSELSISKRTRGSRSKVVNAASNSIASSSSVLIKSEAGTNHDADDLDGPSTSKRKTRSRASRGKKQDSKDEYDFLQATAATAGKQNGTKLDCEDNTGDDDEVPIISKGRKKKNEVKSKKKAVKSDQKSTSKLACTGDNGDSLVDEPSTSKEVTSSSRKSNSNLKSKPSSFIMSGNIDNKGDSNSKKDDYHDDDSDSNEDSDDWEEVEEAQIDDDEDKKEALENYKPHLPEQGVQITIDGPKIFNKKRRKKQVNVDEILRQQLNRMKKELQVEMHKTHLLCLLGRGFYLNRITFYPLISSLALSHLTDFTFDLKKVNLLFVRDFTNWFRSWFTLEKKTRSKVDLLDSLTQAFETKIVQSQVEYVLMFLSFLRVYSPKIQLRLCYAFNPISIKPDNLIMTEKQRSRTKPSKDESEETSKRQSSDLNEKAKPPSSKLYGENSNEKSKKTTTNKKTGRGKKRKKDSDEEDEDYDMESSDEETNKKRKGKGKAKVKAKGNQKSKKHKNNDKSMLSEDGDSNDLGVIEPVEEKNLLEYWCEIFVDTEERWICLDVESGTWDKPSDIEKRSHNPLLYVISWDNFSHIKDVSQRYCSDYASCKFRRCRVEEAWWTETLSYFRPRKRTRQEKKEDGELADIIADRPMPTSLSDFKNHPLYVLKKHLLKYEVIYPPDAPALGNFRGEPVYARECVKDVHSREYWMRQARVVRPNEEPYKISIKRKKWDRNLGDFLRDLPLDLFGEWQTDPYIPPEAKDGKVPRNMYGNVELFQPCMLPKGTVYLQLPGLIRIANKLKIDCAPAVVGFDNCSGGAGVHPVFEGFVVCEEFGDTLKAAWEEEQMNIRKREIEKREKRIYGNWKRLIRGVLIREQLRLKYNRDQSDDNETKSSMTMEDIDVALSMLVKKRAKASNKLKKTKTSKVSKKPVKRRSRKNKDSSEEEDDEDDIDDFIVDDDDQDLENEQKVKNDEEEEEAETEIESTDSD